MPLTNGSTPMKPVPHLVDRLREQGAQLTRRRGEIERQAR
jgi:hypothetical protein